MTDERWRITVDRGTCIGSAVCVGTAPARFALNGGTSEPIDAEIDPDEAAIDAAESCPMEAIRVVEIGSGKVLAPEE
jgi:ferredoxin